MRRLLPSRAMAVALLALAFAVGGGSALAATVTLDPGAVGTAAIHNGAVTASKLHQGAVGPYNLNAASKKLIATAVTGKTGKAGATGKTGAPGIVGPVGPAGPAGAPGANATNPVKRLYFTAGAGTGATNVFSANGINIYATCSNAGYVSVTAQATNSAPGVLAYSLTTNAGTSSQTGTSSTGTNTGGIYWYTDSSFGAASSSNAAPFSGPSIVLTSAYNTSNQPENTGSGASDSVQFNYTSSSGAIVTGQFATTDNGTNTNTSSNSNNPGPASLATCTAYGTATTL